MIVFYLSDLKCWQLVACWLEKSIHPLPIFSPAAYCPGCVLKSVIAPSFLFSLDMVRHP